MLYPQNNIFRTAGKLDGIWKFAPDREDTGIQEKWFYGLPSARKIAVPASWNEQYTDLYQFHGKGWYETSFPVSRTENGQAVYLRFGSVTGKTTVWLNGREIMSHEGGHLPFECEITPYLISEAENRLTVLTDNTLDPWALPPAVLCENEGRVGFQNSYPAVTYDFFPYSGIHRSVWLYRTAAVRIEDITVTTDIQTGTVHFCVALSDKVSGSLTVELEQVQTVLNIKNTDTIRGELRTENPKLWDIGCPNLYSLIVRLFVQGKETDRYTQRFGFRSVEVKGDKLLLNGREIFLKGFGKHEDFHVSGRGFQPALMIRDFDLMHWIGANSFRTSHYPYDEQILDYADENGILVIDETPFVGLNDRMYRPDILDKAKQIIRTLIQRDKNHPSVILWSLANEPNVDTKEGELFFKEIAETARSLDPSRPITYVAHLEPENNLGMPYFDLICLNKYYGWYYGPGMIDDTLNELANCLERFHQSFQKGILVTEFGADAVAGMHSLPEQMFSEEYQSEIIEKQYALFKRTNYVCGTHIWAFADFKTAQGISRVMLNRKGVFSRERYPKLAAHTLKRLWRE